MNMPSFLRMRQIAAVLFIVMGLLSCNVFTGVKKTEVLSTVQPTELVVTEAEPEEVAPTATRAAIPTSTRPAPTARPVIPTSTETAGEIEVLEYTYSQDFSGASTEWNLEPYENDSVKASYAISDGQYVWNVHSKKATTSFNVPTSTGFLPQGDFLVTAFINMVSQGNPVSAGILFRFQDNSNFYYAKLNQLGEVSVFAYENNEWVSLVDPVKSSHYMIDDYNRLIVVEKNGTYEVQVNDYTAATFTDDRFAGGAIGLIVEMDANQDGTFFFDDVRIMQTGSSAAQGEEPSGLPTMVGMGAALNTYYGDYNGIKYEMDHFFVFVHKTQGEWETFCLDVPEYLCVSIHPQSGNWENSQAMGKAIMADYSSTLSDYQVYHAQTTQTADGFEAYWFGYTATRSGAKIEGSRLFILIQHVGFDIATEGEPAMMEVYREVTKMIVESFRLNYQ